MRRTSRSYCLVVIAIGLVIAVFPGCRPREQTGLTAPANLETVQFAPALGRAWSHVSINATTSKDYVGFRARYALLEAEYEEVTPAQVWREKGAGSLTSAKIFFDLHPLYVRQVRPVGSSGWCTGYFYVPFYNQTRPENLFSGLNGVLFSGEPGQVEPPAGKIVQDFPDGGVRTGIFVRQFQRANAGVIDISEPDFPQKMKALIDAKLVEIEERNLPFPIQRLPRPDRAQALATLNKFLEATRETLQGKHEWRGTVIFPKTSVPVRLTTNCSVDGATPVNTQLLAALIPAAGQGDTFQISGGIETRSGAPDFLACFWMQTANLTPSALQATRDRMATKPLRDARDVSNCYLRILDRRRIEIRADGMPPTVLTLVK